MTLTAPLGRATRHPPRGNGRLVDSKTRDSAARCALVVRLGIVYFALSWREIPVVVPLERWLGERSACPAMRGTPLIVEGGGGGAREEALGVKAQVRRQPGRPMSGADPSLAGRRTWDGTELRPAPGRTRGGGRDVGTPAAIPPGRTSRVRARSPACGSQQARTGRLPPGRGIRRPADWCKPVGGRRTGSRWRATVAGRPWRARLRLSTGAARALGRAGSFRAVSPRAARWSEAFRNTVQARTRSWPGGGRVRGKWTGPLVSWPPTVPDEGRRAAFVRTAVGRASVASGSPASAKTGGAVGLRIQGGREAALEERGRKTRPLEEWDTM